MKKFIGLVALVVALALPISVNAASLKTKCDKTCPTADGKCTATCAVTVEGNEATLTTFSGTLEVVGDGVTVKDFKAGEGWRLSCYLLLLTLHDSGAFGEDRQGGCESHS